MIIPSVSKTVVKIFHRLSYNPSASSAENRPTVSITQSRCSPSHAVTLPPDQVGAISATASTARNGQYQLLQRGKRSLPPGGRHNAASASRIGYSAIHENV